MQKLLSLPGTVFELMCLFRRSQQQTHFEVKAFMGAVARGGCGGVCGGKARLVELLCTTSHLMKNVAKSEVFYY